MRVTFAAFLAILVAGPALAASPEEDLVRGWIDAMAGGAPVGIGSSLWDPARRAVDLENVTVGTPGGALVVTIGQVSVEAPRRMAGQMLAMAAVRASDVKVAVHVDLKRWFPAFAEMEEKRIAEERDGDVAEEGEAQAPPERLPTFDITVTYETMLLERVEVPTAAPVIAADATLIASALDVARWSLGMRIDWMESTRVETVTTGAPDVESRVSYGRFYAAGLHDGRIERVGMEDYHQAAPLEPGEFADMTIGRAEAIGVDNRRLMEVLDPVVGADGSGDGKWRVIAERLVYEDLSFKGPQSTPFDFGIDRMDFTGMRMRPVGKPLLGTWETILKDPSILDDDPPMQLIEDMMSGMFGLYGIDAGTISGIDLGVAPAFSGRVGTIEVSRVDSDGVGAITIRDIGGTARGPGVDEDGSVDGDTPSEGAEIGSASVALLTFNDIRFGSLAPWLALGEAETTGEEPKPELLRDVILKGMPSLGFFELAGLAVNLPGSAFSLDGYTSSASDFLDRLPRRTDVTITGLSYPVSAIPDPTTRDRLLEMDYDSVTLSAALTARWDPEKGDAHIDDLTVTAEDVGTISADLHLGNLPLSAFLDPETIDERLPMATLVSASTLFANQSIVERIFKVQAKPLNQDPEEFRKNFGAGMPLMLGFLGDADVQKTFASALKTFFDDPKSIRVTAKPVAPLPLAALEGLDGSTMDAAGMTPGAVLKLLGLSVEANR